MRTTSTRRPPWNTSPKIVPDSRSSPAKSPVSSLTPKSGARSPVRLPTEDVLASSSSSSSSPFGVVPKRSAPRPNPFRKKQPLPLPFIPKSPVLHHLAAELENSANSSGILDLETRIKPPQETEWMADTLKSPPAVPTIPVVVAGAVATPKTPLVFSGAPVAPIVPPAVAAPLVSRPQQLAAHALFSAVENFSRKLVGRCLRKLFLVKVRRIIPIEKRTVRHLRGATLLSHLVDRKIIFWRNYILRQMKSRDSIPRLKNLMGVQLVSSVVDRVEVRWQYHALLRFSGVS